MIFLSGLFLGFALIMSLGPQNVFLIRQGALRQYPILSASVCFICDILLVGASIAGLHHFLEMHPLLANWVTLLGALFLFYYGGSSLRSAFKKNAPAGMHSKGTGSRTQIILFAIGFSLLNPQAIIDTMLIIGGGSARYTGHLMAFGSGILLSSLIWFFSLTLLARHFSQVLTQAKVWSWLEFISGCLMIGIGLSLYYACSQSAVF